MKICHSSNASRVLFPQHPSAEVCIQQPESSCTAQTRKITWELRIHTLRYTGSFCPRCPWQVPSLYMSSEIHLWNRGQNSQERIWGFGGGRVSTRWRCSPSLNTTSNHHSLPTAVLHINIPWLHCMLTASPSPFLFLHQADAYRWHTLACSLSITLSLFSLFPLHPPFAPLLACEESKRGSGEINHC